MKPDIETRLRGANPLPRDQQLEQLYGQDVSRRLLADVRAKREGRMTDTTDRRQPAREEKPTNGQVTRLVPDRTERSRRPGPRLAWAAAAAVIAVGAIAGLIILTNDEPDVAGTPADPVATATAFLQAYTTGDAATAAAFLADDAHFEYIRLADTGGFAGQFGDLGVEGLSLVARFDDAVGMTWLPGPCEVQTTTSAGTNLVCPYDFHGFYSDERGLGPYSGSTYHITVQDGEITSFTDTPTPDSNAWEEENWDAFTIWVAQAHPEDWATLSDEEAIASLVASSPDQAIEMYERLIQGFLEFERQAGTPDDPVATATAFLQAYTTGDADTAAALLADDAYFESIRPAEGGAFSGEFSEVGVEGLALIARFDEAVGMSWLPGPCEVGSSTSAGTNLVCPYDFHGFYSDERGLGPYSGSAYRITVLDGKITSFTDIPMPNSDAWEEENWDAFNTWVSETHPEDWAILSDEQAIASLIASDPDQLIEMYERLMPEFVEYENQGS